MTVSIEQLSAYHDGELAPDERNAVGAHVAQCGDCRIALERWASAARSLSTMRPGAVTGRRIAVAVLAGVVMFLTAASGAALGMGLFSEIFRSGNVSAVASRPVTLDEARVSGLPLPRTDRLPAGWKIDQVQLTMTPSWSAVDVQYGRPGSRGMGITAWSDGINVEPNGEHVQVLTVSGVAVEVKRNADSLSARFVDGGSTVIIRAFTDEVGVDEIGTLAAAWIEQTR